MCMSEKRVESLFKYEKKESLSIFFHTVFFCVFSSLLCCVSGVCIAHRAGECTHPYKRKNREKRSDGGGGGGLSEG
jgi:hypothetical protein